MMHKKETMNLSPENSLTRTTYLCMEAGSDGISDGSSFMKLQATQHGK